jgi:serine/threonine protein kinase
MSRHDMTQTATITCAGCKHSYVETALFCPNCGRPKVRAAGSGDPLIGTVLGERFLVQEQIGQGGSGTIYRAEHVTLRRKVGIKVLHAELSRDDLAVERFRREATTVAEIDNEHIVEIHDFGRTLDGRLYLAMELLEGETLDSVLFREKTLSVERVADILIQVGEALMEAHAIGYIHRDLRPRNIYLAVRRGKANFVKLLDFGLAKLVETDAQAASTSLGMTFGDPRYMSPEQARGDRIDRRADIYQLGCMAYEMLTGSPPFTGNRVFDILTKQVNEIPAPLPTRRPGVPLWMEAGVAKMLAKDPENRFATTTRMVEALRRGLETGEVMEEEVARRRESIPPPSVSRVMQKFGVSQPGDAPREMAPKAEIPATPAPAPAPPPSAPPVVVGKETLRYEPPKPASAPIAVPVPVAVTPSAPVPVPVSDSAPVAAPGRPFAATEPVTALADPPAAKPATDSRKRTGTPRVGVPVVSAAAVADASDEAVPQPPVAGSIQAPTGRTRRPSSSSSSSSSGGPTDSSGISQVWYDEGERESSEADGKRASKLISPSTTDMSFYDEPARRKRWPIFAAIGGVAMIGTVIAVAMTRGGGDDKKPAPAQPEVAMTVPADAPPSQIIESTEGSGSAAVAIESSGSGSTKRTPGTTTNKIEHRVAVTPQLPAGGGGQSSADDLAHRRPGGGGGTTTNPDTTGGGNTVTHVIVPPNNGGTGHGSGAGGVSGAQGPEDPYGADPNAEPPPDAPAERRAEYYANQGQQQLYNGDNANAAANFKRAMELDGKNVRAAMGMGEIALRQGLYGDAVAHLKRASKLSPKNARVFTLLGQAYLNSGQNALAAENFKKALQLDPNNADARDGYNDASSKVPPPEDDSP